jgi:hypothetical protein
VRRKGGGGGDGGGVACAWWEEVAFSSFTLSRLLPLSLFLPLFRLSNHALRKHVSRLRLPRERREIEEREVTMAKERERTRIRIDAERMLQHNAKGYEREHKTSIAFSVVSSPSQSLPLHLLELEEERLRPPPPPERLSQPELPRPCPSPAPPTPLFLSSKEEEDRRPALPAPRTLSESSPLVDYQPAKSPTRSPQRPESARRRRCARGRCRRRR